MSDNEGNVFESINLDSTMRNAKRKKDIQAIDNRVPESVSATSDDDELDPEEFLSQELPQIFQKIVNPPSDDLEELERVGILNSTTIIGEKGTSKNIEQVHNNEVDSSDVKNKIYKEKESQSSLFDSSILNSIEIRNQTPINNKNSTSIQFPELHKSDKESTIKLLLESNSNLQNELHKNIKTQKRLLEDGDDTNRVRSFISYNFNLLSQNFYSLSELYSQEVNNTKSLTESFKRWDIRREKILKKISFIKSDKNRHGSKLARLLDESSSIDEEILDLENKLAALKSKKKLINAEIEDTSSVLESRTSKYVDTFKKLEKQGAEAIVQFLDMNSVGSKDSIHTIKYVPVDVTFSNHYRNTLNTNMHKDQENGTSTVINNIVPIESKRDDPIGMQPLIVPEIAIEKNNYLANHGHGPTPFEEGLEKGSKAARNVRVHLNSFIKSLVPSTLDEKETLYPAVQIDDISNTINKKIDLTPIIRLLDSMEENSQGLIMETSKKATLYHEYGIVWNDVVNIIQYQENRLLSQLSESAIPKGEMDKNIITILSSSLEQLKACILKSITRISSMNLGSLNIQNSVLYKCTFYEVKAICSALVVASGDNGYHEKIEEFEAFLSDFQYETNNISNNQEKSQDEHSTTSKLTTIYKPSKTIVSTGATNINYVSSGSSSSSSNAIRNKPFSVDVADHRGLMNLSSKIVKSE